ncbi:MAG: prepilin peptidase [Thermodesulfobacteriota bacterium]
MLLLLIKVLVFFIGLCLGSFLNVVIHRLPRPGISISHPRRSFCPRCTREIRWYDNLPLVSYVLLRGRCRHCGLPISPRYPLVELICGLLALAVYYKSYPTLGFRTLADLYLALALVAVSFIDLDHFLIPDEITIPGLLVGLAAAILAPEIGLAGPWLAMTLSGLAGGYWGPALLWLAVGVVLAGVLFWVGERLYEGRFEEEDAEEEAEDLTLGEITLDFLGRRTAVLTLAAAAVGLLAVLVLGAAGAGRAGPIFSSWFQERTGLSLFGSVLGLVLGGGLIYFIFALYLLVRGQEGMGLGDLVLLAMIGSFLGWRSIFFTVFIGSLTAMGAYLVSAAAARSFNLKEMLPFGPFLSLAALVYLFFGERILAWYLG